MTTDPMLAYRISALETLFRQIADTRMAGLPVINRALRVEAVGFEPCASEPDLPAAVSGVLVGRPMDGVWQAEYEQLLRQVIDDPALPVVCGLNVGHALPRCIVPLGVPARVDVQAQKIEFL